MDAETTDATPPTASADPVITGIKGFDSDWTCRGFKFEHGATYEEAAPIVACKNGFHAIPDEQHPLSVFSYYPPAGSRYAEVTQSGAIDKEIDKIASAKITIGVEISLGELTKRAIKWVFDRAKNVEGRSATGYRGAAQASGDRGAAQASGDRGAAQASGDQGAAQASGDQGAAQASGDRGAAQASGDQGAAQASGDRGAAQASGDQGASSATGKHCVAMAIGVEARAMATETNGICLAHRDANTGKLLALRAAKVGEHGVKSGVWYTLSADGEFVEVDKD